jgi:hypothetical protein
VSERADVAVLINDFGMPHRAETAFLRIMMLGRDALADVEVGLSHENPDVRLYCTLALDRLAGTNSFVMLLPLLDDPDARVRSRALHSLACDRCKRDDVCLLEDNDPSARSALATTVPAQRQHPRMHVLPHTPLGSWGLALMLAAAACPAYWARTRGSVRV